MAPQSDETAIEALQPLFDASICMIVLDTIFFTLRYVARIWIKRVPLGLDDIALGLSYLANLAICSVGLSELIALKHERSAHLLYSDVRNRDSRQPSSACADDTIS